MQSLRPFFLFLLLLLASNACKKDIGDGEINFDHSDTSGTVEIDGTDATNFSFTEEFLKLVNDHRSEIGRKALILDYELSRIVQKHSEDMASGSLEFGHTGFSERCADARIVLGEGNWCGENVAAGQNTPQSVFNAWMNSPGHKANIEQVRASHTGFGYKKSISGTYYWTQIFLEF